MSSFYDKLLLVLFSFLFSCPFLVGYLKVVIVWFKLHTILYVLKLALEQEQNPSMHIKHIKTYSK